MGFFREGCKELGRKWTRSRLRGQQRRQEAERRQALTRLGQRAWQEKVDLAGSPALASQLAQLDTRAGLLSATTKNLESERAALEEKRRAAVARFDGERRAVEEKKHPVDDSLRAARQRQTDQQRTVERLESRLVALPKELAALEQQTAALTAGAAPGRDAKLAAAAAKRQELEGEKVRLGSEVPAARAALPDLLTEVNRLDAESQRLAAELSRIEGERKSTLGALDAELNRVRGELAATARESGTVEQERSDRFAQLGLGLYERRVASPALAEGQKEVATIDEKRAATQAALQAALAESQALPAGTMLKFAAVLVLVPVLLVGLGYGAYWGWERWQEGERVVLEPVNPYLAHPLSDHPAYVLANRLADAPTEAEAAQQLLELCRALHLGVYRSDGQRILAGAERDQNDFFLYEFQRKILAHAFFERNVTSFPDQSYVFGQAFLELENPEILEPFLAEAVARRYQEAVAHPDDPMNFLILAVDGLARRQLQPYSLDELPNRSHERLYLDPVQSFLLMLDFFLGSTHGAAETPAARLRRPPSWLEPPTVHASPGCEDILGDGGKEAWGRGVDAAGDVMEQAGESLAKHALEKFGKTFGRVTGAVQAAGSLLFLYGVSIKVEPQPAYVHLNTPETWNQRAAFLATVTFDAQGVSDKVLECGWLVGKTMPKNGPVKDAELYWDFQPFLSPDFEADTETMWRAPGEMEQKGLTLAHTAEGFRTLTDEAGKSYFFLKVIKSCRDHPRGKIVAGRQYLATVSVRHVTREIPTPGLLGAIGLVLKLGPGTIEYLMRGRSGYGRIWTEWHEKRKQPPY